MTLGTGLINQFRFWPVLFGASSRVQIRRIWTRAALAVQTAYRMLELKRLHLQRFWAFWNTMAGNLPWVKATWDFQVTRNRNFKDWIGTHHSRKPNSFRSKIFFFWIFKAHGVLFKTDRLTHLSKLIHNKICPVQKSKSLLSLNIKVNCSDGESLRKRESRIEKIPKECPESA